MSSGSCTPARSAPKRGCGADDAHTARARQDAWRRRLPGAVARPIRDGGRAPDRGGARAWAAGPAGLGRHLDAVGSSARVFGRRVPSVPAACGTVMLIRGADLLFLQMHSLSSEPAHPERAGKGVRVLATGRPSSPQSGRRRARVAHEGRNRTRLRAGHVDAMAGSCASNPARGCGRGVAAARPGGAGALRAAGADAPARGAARLARVGPQATRRSSARDRDRAERPARAAVGRGPDAGSRPSVRPLPGAPSQAASGVASPTRRVGAHHLSRRDRDSRTAPSRTGSCAQDRGFR